MSKLSVIFVHSFFLACSASLIILGKIIITVESTPMGKIAGVVFILTGSLLTWAFIQMLS